MSPLSAGTEIILAVSGDWYREIARQGLLPATPDTGPSELLSGKFLEQTHDGIWIDLPDNISQMIVPSFFVPSRLVWAIVIGDIAQRREIGFTGSTHQAASAL